MNTDGFRRIALEMPLAEESSHMGQPDFRVAGKIFASLPRRARRVNGKGGAAGKAKGRADAAGRPQEALGMVKLSPGQQAEFVRARPQAFAPVPGMWGARGATFVVLKEVDARTMRRAMKAAWEATAPKSVLREFGEDPAVRERRGCTETAKPISAAGHQHPANHASR